MMLEEALHYAREHREAFLQALREYLSIPSISAQPEHERDVKMAALWLAEHLRERGLSAELLPTGGNPVVYAEWKSSHAHAPTVLIYGHYDVQPPDPLEPWHTPPFDPHIREGYIFARGADDNKGQHFAHIKAIESLLCSTGALPLNVKLLIEGEEEIGSAHLGRFVRDHRDLLACDCVLISDSAMHSLQQPTLIYGLRGLLDVEIRVRALSRDVHSGHYGGNVQNPILALAQLLAQVKDAEGRILIPGFYDDVRTPDAAERAQLARLSWGEVEIMRETGALCAFGEPEFTPVERKGIRPTFEVNGMWGGYTGHGIKTIIPAEAHAKITCRLVPHQDPARVGAAVRQFLEERCPPGVALDVRVGAGSPPTLLPLESSAIQAAIRAATATYGATPLFELEGGSIPVVHDFAQVLQKPIVLLGFGLPQDNIHSPNEKFALESFERGIEASVRFLIELSAIN